MWLNDVTRLTRCVWCGMCVCAACLWCGVVSGDGKGEKADAARTQNLKVFMQAFTLTFLAEWGDRSQIGERATI